MSLPLELSPILLSPSCLRGDSQYASVFVSLGWQHIPIPMLSLLSSTMIHGCLSEMYLLQESCIT